jgi:hypothetical protein
MSEETIPDDREMTETALGQVFSQNPTRIQYSIYRLFDTSNNTFDRP